MTKGSLVSHEAKENWREAARLRALVEKEVPILVRCSNGKMQEGSAHSMLSREGGDRYLNMSQAKARGFLELDHYSPLPEYAKNLQPIGQQLGHSPLRQLSEEMSLQRFPKFRSYRTNSIAREGCRFRPKVGNWLFEDSIPFDNPSDQSIN